MIAWVTVGHIGVTVGHFRATPPIFDIFLSKEVLKGIFILGDPREDLGDPKGILVDPMKDLGDPRKNFGD